MKSHDAYKTTTKVMLATPALMITTIKFQISDYYFTTTITILLE